MVYPVLEFREEKRTFAKVEEGNVDFFVRCCDGLSSHVRGP